MTIKTLTEVNTLLANNTSGAISPTDMRDVIDSQGVHGGMSVQDAAPIDMAIAVAGTPELATYWDVDGPSYGVVPDSTTNNDLEIPAGGDGTYAVHFDLSFGTSINPSTIFQARLRINGAENGDGCHRSISGTTIGTTGFDADVDGLVAGDLLTIWVEMDAIGAGVNIEVHDSHFKIRRIR